ncbi:hypothetical protein E2C01_084702 [Portunus trituberculatus]|uniref:Uncharacterized protein n=1 Tax=Portunus trituberculatus TaxID=210409 RepID=A0A5B7J5I7_PORTR|nr:hypothetical protein [Portunus trituberculatus]
MKTCHGTERVKISPLTLTHLLAAPFSNLGNNSFPELPHEGLNKVISIKVHNNRYLREFPGPENFPLVRTLTLSYAYHCCPFLRLRDTTEAPKIIEDVVFSVEGLNNLDPTIWNVSSVWPDIGGKRVESPHMCVFAGEDECVCVCVW